MGWGYGIRVGGFFSSSFLVEKGEWGREEVVDGGSISFFSLKLKLHHLPIEESDSDKKKRVESMVFVELVFDLHV